MSTLTAPLHTPAELSFHGCDDHTGIVAFVAPSEHDAARVNTTALDTLTGAIHCDCRGAECHRACWHADHITAAWLASPAMRAVRWLTTDQLLRYGLHHAGLVATYRARIGRALPADLVAVTAARCEWRRRAALAPLLRVDLPLAA